MPTVKHVHKYRKVKMGKDYEVFRCVKPNCPHFISITLAEGRFSECWKCGDVFVLSASAVQRVKPKCPNCVSSKRITEFKETLKALEEAL